MAENRIRAQLDELANVIEQLPATSPQRDALNNLVSEIEQELATSSPLARNDTLAQRIRENVSEFETEHPTAAGLLNNIAAIFTNIGV